MNDELYGLLAANEPAPITVHRENGWSPFLIAVDHAGNLMPHGLGRLGLPKTESSVTSPGTLISPRFFNSWRKRSTPP